MWDLRWVLLGLGALVVAGVYLWSRGLFRSGLFGSRKRVAERTEPSLGADIEGSAPGSATETRMAEDEPGLPPDRIVALRLVPRGQELPAAKVIKALGGAGLEFGRYSIFHRQLSGNKEAFSVASLTEPGSFQLEPPDDATVAGLSFFLVLPGKGDPVARFDAMVETARGLSVELAADLFDERGSSWSSQRERYLREELIEYRHQLERR